MEINYLREFVILAETEHYLEASNKLFISQSTLSKHIKRIETELNVPLFNRTTRKVELSDYGRLLLPYARQIIQLCDQSSEALLNIISEEQKKVKIGSIPALAPYNITELMVRFRKDHPGFQIQVVQESSNTLKEMLRNERVELAFIREIEWSSDEFIRIPYSEDAMAAAIPLSHRLAGQDIVNVADLKGDEFLLVGEETTTIYNLAVKLCEESGFTPHIAYSDHKVENIIDLVEKGMGTAMLMKKLALHHQKPHVKVVDLHQRASSKINLCYLRHARLSTAAKHFIQCLKGY